MFGRNSATAPTPPIIPSTTNERQAPSGIIPLNRLPKASNPAAIQSCGYAPSQNVTLNISHISSINRGKPSHLFTISLSSLRVRLLASFLPSVKVSCSAPEMKPYFASLMAVSASISSCLMIFSDEISACFFSFSYDLLSFSRLWTSLSFSIIFIAQ